MKKSYSKPVAEEVRLNLQSNIAQSPYIGIHYTYTPGNPCEFTSLSKVSSFSDREVYTGPAKKK